MVNYTIKDFGNDPTWTRSIGEKLGIIHFRNGHWHAECEPPTGICKIHYDKHDPHESMTSLIKHMLDSYLGTVVLVSAGIAVLDQIFTGGQIRRAVLRSL